MIWMRSKKPLCNSRIRTWNYLIQLISVFYLTCDIRLYVCENFFEMICKLSFEIGELEYEKRTISKADKISKKESDI